MYTYVVEHDFAFAPNPFFGICSLATCKPSIREKARVGDLLVGAGSKKNGRECHLVYYMVVSEVLTHDEYWADERFESKRPTMDAGIMKAVGDNIYHSNQDGSWSQEYSLHRAQGAPVDIQHLMRDTKSQQVLLGSQFAYWGGEGPKIPKKLLENHEKSLVGGRPVRSLFSDRQIKDTYTWLLSLNTSGFAGRPVDWVQIPRAISDIRF